MGSKPKKLTRKDIEKCRELLIQTLRELTNDLSMLEEDINSNRQSSGSFSRIPTHPSDISGDTFEQDFTYERIEAEDHEIEAIREALAKINNGTYGICERCKSPIRKQRLLALPYCKYCISCQEAIEKETL